MIGVCPVPHRATDFWDEAKSNLKTSSPPMVSIQNLVILFRRCLFIGATPVSGSIQVASSRFLGLSTAFVS